MSIFGLYSAADRKLVDLFLFPRWVDDSKFQKKSNIENVCYLENIYSVRKNLGSTGQWIIIQPEICSSRSSN